MLQDLRYALRSLARTPGFAIVAVLTLGLGIGATTAVFTIINSIWFKPLPVPNPQRLVIPYMSTSAWQFPDFFSTPDYRDIAAHHEVFSDVMGHNGVPLSWSRSGKAQLVWGEVVTGNYFSGLGVQPALGRTFLPEECATPDSHPVAVLAYHFWQKLGSNPDITGRLIKLNGREFTIVGVAPRGFVGTRLVGFTPDLWVPYMMYSQVLGVSAAKMEQRDFRWMRIIARMQPNVSTAQVRALLGTVAQQWEQAYPETNKGVRMGLVSGATRTDPFLDTQGLKTAGSGLLMGTALLVLLVACSNVANLLLARASTRQKEMAMRLALGAGRTRLVRLLLTESVMLAAAGAGLGLILASWFNDALAGTKPNLDFSFGIDFGMDWHVMAYTAGAALATGILFGLIPALQATRPDLSEALKAGATTSGGRGRWTLRQSLIVAQVAFSLVALIVAGLFIRSSRNAQRMDLGFQKGNVLVASVDLNLAGYDEARGRRFYKQLVERLKTLPGVESTALGYPLPLDDESGSTDVWVEGFQQRNAGDKLEIMRSIVDSNYFSTMKTALVEGRGFTVQDDASAPHVAIINETMAQRFWPGQDAVGRRFRLGDSTGDLVQVIGVAKNGKYLTVGEGSLPYLFLPLEQHYQGKVRMVLRSAGDPRSLAAGVRQVVGEMDGDLPVFGVKTMDEFLDRLLSIPKGAAAIVGVFGFLALLMASVGLYGLLSYAVARRTREIGIRMALGARRSDVLTLVARQGMVLTGIGVAVGLGLTFAVSRLVTSMLYDVSATDPSTFLAFSLILAAVALVACLLPARRATRVDPMVALRYE